MKKADPAMPRPIITPAVNWRVFGSVVSAISTSARA